MMRSVLSMLLWPLVGACHLGLEILIWFKPDIAQGRCVFPASIQNLIAKARRVEVHYAELRSDEPSSRGELGTPMGFRSLGMAQVVSERDCQRVIRSVLKANRECLGGFLCLDAEYGLRFESPLGGAELMVCFWCMQVWVKAEAEGAERFYPISRRPQALLDRLLGAAGVSQPIRREK